MLLQNSWMLRLLPANLTFIKAEIWCEGAAVALSQGWICPAHIPEQLRLLRLPAPCQTLLASAWSGYNSATGNTELLLSWRPQRKCNQCFAFSNISSLSWWSDVALKPDFLKLFPLEKKKKPNQNQKNQTNNNKKQEEKAPSRITEKSSSKKNQLNRSSDREQTSSPTSV